MPVSPEEMAAMQEQAGGGGGEGPGKATALAQKVGEGLSQLAELLNGSQGVTDQDRDQMAQIMESFVDLVEKKLGGQAPGQDAPPEEEPMPKAVSAEGGLKGQPMGPQGRM